jgi:hypothetical protein
LGLEEPVAYMKFNCIARASAGVQAYNRSSGEMRGYHQCGYGVDEYWTWNGPAGSEAGHRISVDYEYGYNLTGVGAYAGGDGTSSDYLGSGCSGATYSDSYATAGLVGEYTLDGLPSTDVDIVDMFAHAVGGGYLGGSAVGWNEAYIDPELPGDSLDQGPPALWDYGYGSGASVSPVSHSGGFTTPWGTHRLRVSRGTSCRALASAYASSTGNSWTYAKTTDVYSSAVLASYVGVTVENQ